jgi:hypothetical protein
VYCLIIIFTIRFYFSDDSSYFDGFKERLERFGPFDLTIIKTSTYDADWPTIHMILEQSLVAKKTASGYIC